MTHSFFTFFGTWFKLIAEIYRVDAESWTTNVLKCNWSKLALNHGTTTFRLHNALNPSIYLSNLRFITSALPHQPGTSSTGPKPCRFRRKHRINIYVLCYQQSVTLSADKHRDNEVKARSPHPGPHSQIRRISRFRAIGVPSRRSRIFSPLRKKIREPWPAIGNLRAKICDADITGFI